MTFRRCARKRVLAAIALCATAIAPAVASAVDLPIVNPSFEDNVVPNPSGIVSGLPNGWQAYSDGAVSGTFYGSLHAVATNYPLGAPDGVNVPAIYVSAAGTAGVAFGIRQVLTTNLAVDTLYTLEVEVGNIDSGFNDLPNTPLNPNDDTFFDLQGYNGYRIELWVDDGGPGVMLDQDVDSGPPILDGEFQLRSFTYDSTGVAANVVGLPLEIRLINRNLVDPSFPTSDRETNFDDVRLDATPVSQPLPISPLAPWGVAIALLGVASRRLRE